MAGVAGLRPGPRQPGGVRPALWSGTHARHGCLASTFGLRHGRGTHARHGCLASTFDTPVTESVVPDVAHELRNGAVEVFALGVERVVDHCRQSALGCDSPHACRTSPHRLFRGDQASAPERSGRVGFEVVRDAIDGCGRADDSVPVVRTTVDGMENPATELARVAQRLFDAGSSGWVEVNSRGTHLLPLPCGQAGLGRAHVRSREVVVPVDAAAVVTVDTVAVRRDGDEVGQDLGHGEEDSANIRRPASYGRRGVDWDGGPRKPGCARPAPWSGHAREAWPVVPARDCG